MRTTLDIKEDLLELARTLSGLKEKTALVHAGLEALIERESKKRLIALAGTDKKAKAPTGRRRS